MACRESFWPPAFRKYFSTSKLSFSACLAENPDALKLESPGFFARNARRITSHGAICAKRSGANFGLSDVRTAFWLRYTSLASISTAAINAGSLPLLTHA
jgi:hypothetical protein